MYIHVCARFPIPLILANTNALEMLIHLFIQKISKSAGMCISTAEVLKAEARVGGRN